MPTLARINIFPLKSFDPQSVDEAVLLARGGLRYDRQFALVDRSGQFVNGKNTPAIHRIRSSFDPASGRLTLGVGGSGEGHSFDVNSERTELASWLGEQLGRDVTILENAAGGFPDDTDSPGPTVIGTATLAEVARWFAGVTAAEARDRFRPNLEIETDEPFWEDRLVADGLSVVRFRVGEAQLLGTNPCQRCPVPSRNPYTGEPLAEFARTFARRRHQTLPPWAPASRFDHFYRLAVNTRRVGGRECTLRVGDEVRVLEVA
jgi:uncharacterized protein YcbX